jgi:hypothetical protein
VSASKGQAAAYAYLSDLGFPAKSSFIGRARREASTAARTGALQDIVRMLYQAPFQSNLQFRNFELTDGRR